MADAGRSTGRRPAAEPRWSDPTDAGFEAPVPSTVRGPLAGLVDLAAALGDPASAPSTFLRGLALGALVGAAVAGVRLRRRRRRP